MNNNESNYVNFCMKDSKPDIGNILRARQSLHPGDIAISEPPLFIGPNHCASRVCLECLILLESNEQCSKCQWGLCTQCANVQEKVWHTDNECRVLSENGSFFGEDVLMYEAVLPLRLYQEAVKRSDVWRQLENLQDHREVKKNSQEWKFFHEKARK